MEDIPISDYLFAKDTLYSTIVWYCTTTYTSNQLSLGFPEYPNGKRTIVWEPLVQHSVLQRNKKAIKTNYSCSFLKSKLHLCAVILCLWHLWMTNFNVLSSLSFFFKVLTLFLSFFPLFFNPVSVLGDNLIQLKAALLPVRTDCGHMRLSLVHLINQASVQRETTKTSAGKGSSATPQSSAISRTRSSEGGLWSWFGL